MGRDYTIQEWVQQARDWCWADDNDDLDNDFERIQKSNDHTDGEILDLISDIWDREFAPVKTITIKHVGRATPIKVKVVTK